MDRLMKIATALDALADVQDSAPKVAETVDPLVAKLEARLGGPVDADTRHKLASDETYRRTVETLTAQPEAPRSLGGPSEKSAASAPVSKADRMRAAEEQFAAMVMGSR